MNRDVCGVKQMFVMLGAKRFILKIVATYIFRTMNAIGMRKWHNASPEQSLMQDYTLETAMLNNFAY
jgi:hypothetical protein